MVHIHGNRLVHIRGNRVVHYRGNSTIRLDPASKAKYLHHRGIAFTAGGLPEKAIEDFNAAILLDPNFSDIFSERAFAYEQMNDFDHAMADRTESIRLAPNPFLSYFGRANLFEKKGEAENARKDLEQGWKILNNRSPANQVAK